MNTAPPDPSPITALLVAGGSSRRMGFDKLAAPLEGKPVLWHSLDALAACSEVARVILAASPAASELAAGWLENATARKNFAILPGGAERHLSVLAGLHSIDDPEQLVAVHDAARPLVHPEDLAALFCAAQSGPAALALPVADTLQRADAGGIVLETVPRDGLWAMQTPQIARAGILRDAIEQTSRSGHPVTDEVSALRAAGHEVRLVAARHANFKITWPADLALASQVLASRHG